MTLAPAIELRGIRKRYGDFHAVLPFDLAVPPGSTYGLLGPNGAGKTTAIRMLLRIIEPDGGEVRLLGEARSQASLDRVGYLPEERGLYRRMRVQRVLSFLAEVKGVRPRDSAPRIDAWLERFDLADRASARVQDLSKGMQQKVQFIATMLHEPEIVILDEPFSGLDPLNQQILREIISELRREGRTILFSTHIIEHAERLCDHVCIMARGEKVADGPLPEVKRRHGGEYVAVRVEQWTAESLAALRTSPLVASVREHGIEAEVMLREGADPQALLELLVRAGARLRRFECTEASLEQIFIERVGAAPSAEEPEVGRV
jgi:ABC-2 type transport system ATP-binding protein